MCVCVCECVFVLLHPMDTYGTHGELHKNAACCFEQILEAVVRPLTFHLTNHPSKTSSNSRRELSSGVLQWTPTHGNASISRQSSIVLTLDAVKRTCQERVTSQESLRYLPCLMMMIMMIYIKEGF